jgi:hypothetical protein|uniref:Uncharacterized protein n=1 Tax=viral metagenome TaxID=1070528 RepID=A0A6C0C1I8_9ZZZZ
MGRPKFKLFKCNSRVRQLQKQKKPGLTNVKGSHSAMQNHVRRRIAPIVRAYKDKELNKFYKQKYGPLFGIKKIPINQCQDGSTQAKGSLGYASHGGTNADVIYFKHLYGGTRQLLTPGTCPNVPTRCNACKEQKFVNGKAEDKC